MYLTRVYVGLVLLSVVVAVILYIKDPDRRSSDWYARDNARIIATSFVVFTVVMGAILGVVITLIVNFITPNTERLVLDEYRLKALTNTTETEGSYFLFGGSFDNENVYRYITMNDRGGATLREISANNVEIYEDATVETARVEGRIIMRQPENQWTWWEDADFDPWAPQQFHVPPTTVKSEFDVSVKN